MTNPMGFKGRLKGFKALKAADSVYRAAVKTAKLFGREELLMPKKGWWKSDIEFAARFIEENTYGDIPPVFRAGVLWLYEPGLGVWSPNIKETLETRLYKRYHGRKVGHGAQEAIVLNDAKITTIVRHIIRASGPEQMTSINLSPFGTTRGVTFKNGFLGVTADGWALRPARPEDRSTFYLDLDWVDTGPGWFSEVLHKIWGRDPDGAQKADTLGEFAGMALLGLAPTMKRAVMLFGERGDNGKSTLIEVLRHAFGGASSGGFVRAIPPKDFGNPTAIAPLAWARLNAVPELGTEEFPAPEAVKAVISGDTMAGRYLYAHSFDFIPLAGHLFGCNALPTARDPSDAFWKRWIVLECARVIPRSEMDPKGALPGLYAGARLEVLRWVVEGAVRLLRRGAFDPPQSSLKSLDTWRRRSDQIAQYLKTLTPVEPGSPDALQLDEIYTLYVTWSHATGHRRMSKSSFEERIKSAAASAGMASPTWAASN